MSDLANLVIVVHGQYLSFQSDRQAAVGIMNQWIDVRLKGESGVLLHDSERKIFAVNCDDVQGVYVTDCRATPTERMAAAFEKQIGDGEEWRG